jgi:molybdate transport system substrate-binding protein
MIRFWLVALLMTCLTAHAQEGPFIAAASDLKFALDEVAKDFQAKTGKAVRLSYGSSGNFYRQIQQGAPFEMFLSADEGFVLNLAKAGLTVDGGALYAKGRVVLFAPRGSPVRVDARFTDLRAAIQDGRVKKFSIANPEHAPYGRAAREALQHQGLWDAVEPRLVMGENVSQAAQFAMSGSVQASIFALSLALAPNFAQAGAHVLIPEAWHQPLRQRMVLLKRASHTAREFYAFVQQPATRAVFKRYGFERPGE